MQDDHRHLGESADVVQDGKKCGSKSPHKVITHDKFHAPTASAKPALFESIDPSLYQPSVRCAAFCTSKDRLLHWIYVLANRYYNHLNNHATGYKVRAVGTQYTVKMWKNPHNLSSSYNKKLCWRAACYSCCLSVHRPDPYSSKQYKEWSETDFPVLVHIVNSIEWIPPCPSNNSLVTTELSKFFQHYIPFFSEDEILVSNHSISGIAVTSTATEPSNVTLSDTLITTSVAESLSITPSRLSKVRFSTLSFKLD